MQHTVGQMKIRFSLRFLFGVTALVAVVMAAVCYVFSEKEVVIVSQSGIRARLYTTRRIFCDQAEPIFCDLAIRDKAVVTKQIVGHLDCATRLSNSSFVLVDADGGEFVILFTSQIHYSAYREDAVLLVYSERNGMTGPVNDLPLISKREFVDKYFPEMREGISSY